jgi:hypothetical protein
MYIAMVYMLLFPLFFCFLLSMFLMAFCYYFSLTIFIEDNQSGSDVSKIHKIALYGTTLVSLPHVYYHSHCSHFGRLYFLFGKV